MAGNERRSCTNFSEDVTIHGNDSNSTMTTSSEQLPYHNGKGGSDHVQLTRRSWLVVSVACFAQLAQVFVVVGSGQNIAFIARDLGDTELSGWVIQAPLLMQSVLTPTVSRLSDILGRKWLVSVPPLIAFIGAVSSATASSMSTLIGGSVLIGVTLSTIGIVQAIPSEVLPLRYRAIANAAGFVGSGIGGIVGSLGAGRVTSLSPSGWRNIFWVQAALHGATCIGFVLLYHPPRKSDYPQRSFKECSWALDPVGCALFIVGTTLTLLALDWAPSYNWSSAQVIALLCVGLLSLLTFGIYEWKGRKDGIVAHVFFHKSANFALAIFALAVDGWIFYGAVNTLVPQLTLNLGFENNSWSISVRQLSSSATALVACVPITWYATRFKDMKSPLLVTLGIFLASTICYALISPDLDAAQIVYNVLVAVGQAGPLTLLMAVIQLAVPHEHLSTATGLAFSARAIGGTFGTAVLTAIVNSKLKSNYANSIGSAAMNAGLPQSSVASLVEALLSGNLDVLNGLAGINDDIIAQALEASHWVFAHAYRLAWWSTTPFVVVAIVCVACVRSVKDLMSDNIEASVEPPAKSTFEAAESAV